MNRKVKIISVKDEGVSFDLEELGKKVKANLIKQDMKERIIGFKIGFVTCFVLLSAIFLFILW